MIRLADKTALITGAGRRLGRATAEALAGEGMRLVIHHRDSTAAAQELASAINGGGGEAWTVRADLADEEACARLVDRAVELAGPIDVLVNNASIFPESRLESFALEHLEENVRINAFAPLVLSRAFARQRETGCIVNFLDSRIADYDRAHVAYHLSKRMLYTITRMAALELAPGIRVNAVAPGLVLPPPGKDRSYLDKYAHTNPLERVGAAADVARAVVFLAASDFVTGQVIYVDGGRHLKGAVYG